MARDVTDGQVFFDDLRGFNATLVLLKDRGQLPNVTLGSDDESRRFAADVRRLNRRRWKPGQVPRVVPRGRHAVIVHAPARRENVARPREQRARRRSTAPSRGSPDDPSEPEPPPVALLSGFSAASERLQRHLERRSAATMRPA